MVVGSPKTLSSDGVWRSWIRWVRDHGAFLTANALPLCPWESADDSLVSELDVSDLRPFEELDPGVQELDPPCQATDCPQSAHSTATVLTALASQAGPSAEVCKRIWARLT